LTYEGYKNKEARKEYKKNYMQEYRERKKYLKETADTVKRAYENPDLSPENWDRVIKALTEMVEENAVLRNALEPQLRNLDHIKLALDLFHTVHSIAYDPALSDAEKIELIKNFRLPFDTPRYFIHILNEFKKPETKPELKANE
jgi:hypothetical protein